LERPGFEAYVLSAEPKQLALPEFGGNRHDVECLGPVTGDGLEESADLLMTESSQNTTVVLSWSWPSSHSATPSWLWRLHSR
jgi:hypothetical protein